MDDKRVFEGRDLDEALQVAASALGIAEPDLDYEILEQGRRGLFGIGAKSVRIRVMPPIEPLPEESSQPEPRRERRPGDRKRRGGRARGRGGNRGERKGGSKAGGGGGQAAGAKAGSGRSGGKGGGKAAARAPKRTQDAEARDRPAAPSKPIPPEEIEKLETTLQQMLSLMGLELATKVQPDADRLTLELDGDDSELLVKKDAELLGALQFLLNRMSRRAWPEVGRVQLTCNGHRTRRDSDVLALVQEVAQQVSQTGKAKRLHAMNAYERRLVHLTVRKHSDLGSRSEGDGYLKKVRIFKR